MNKNVLVIGEVCHDIFVYGECKRLNPEAPTPVFTPTKEVVNFGMAGNTIENLKHLGFNVLSLEECSVNIEKVRYVDEASNYIILRVDKGESDIKELPITKLPNISLKGIDAVVVSDYNKGLLSDRFLKGLFKMCEENEIPTFIDTKKKINGEWSNWVSFIKINELEYQQQDTVLDKFHKDQLIVTLGNKGCKYKSETYPTDSVEVRDVVGAGDTFLAGLVYGYLKNNDIKEGITIANKLATNVVTKRGVALPDKELL